MMLTEDRRQQMSGFTLIEVLVTLLIVAIGLLGLAGLQMTTLNNQFESYQRAQAVLSIEDMANRIRANSIAARAGSYTVGSQYGHMTVEDCTTKTVTAERDLCEWNIALAGTGVKLSGNNLGSTIGARGCIENIAGSADGEVIVRVTIAWQGLAATVAPSSTCGQNTFGLDDSLRRTASIDAVLANLAL